MSYVQPLNSANILKQIKQITLLLFYLTAGCGVQNNTNNKSSCILLATHDADVSTCSFNFRKDGTFEFTAGMLSDPKEGRYKLDDSIITLENIDFGDIIKSKYLLITKRLPWNPETTSTWLLQVDQKNQLVDSIFVFRVYNDGRNKP